VLWFVTKLNNRQTNLPVANGEVLFCLKGTTMTVIEVGDSMSAEAPAVESMQAVTEAGGLQRVARAVLHFAEKVLTPVFAPVSGEVNDGMSEHFGHAQPRNNPHPPMRDYRG
jgi:hypothetical protein